jgi:hypothetical protein
LVAFITDDAELQRFLPQFIIGSKRRIFRDRDFARLFHAAPDNVYLVQNTTSWNTAHVFCKMIRVLAGVLREHRPDAVWGLSFDAAGCHLERGVFTTCYQEGLFPLLIPARTTWLLQPLDVYVFRFFKQNLRQRFTEAHADGDIDVGLEPCLPIIYQALETTLMAQAQPHIFLGVGLGGRQAQVSDYMKRHLEAPDLAPASLLLPEAAEILGLLPAGRSIAAEL